MKVIKLLSLLLILSLSFSSCGIIIINRGKEDIKITTEDTTEEITTYTPQEYPTKPFPNYEDEAKAALNALPDKNFNGHTVMIAAEQKYSEIFNDTEGPYVSSVLKRNSMIADKYDTVIAVDMAPASTILSRIKLANQSGDFYADFASVRSGDLNNYISSGGIQNFKVLTYTDFSKPYFNKNAIDQMTLNGVIYGVSGAMTDSPESYGCLFYNKTLADELGYGVDYESVYNHTFTWDKLLTQMASVKTDTAVLTSTYNTTDLYRISLLTAGQTFLSKNSSGDFYSNFNTKTSQSVVSNLKKLMSYYKSSFTAEKTVIDENGGQSTQKVTYNNINIFTAGKSLYCFGKVSDMAQIANCGFDWEILPIPKLTEGGSYNAAVTSDAPVVVLLKTSRNIETNGYILQALAAASYKHIQTEYVKYAMANYVSNYYSVDMLELIIEAPLYDHTVIFGGSNSALRNGTYVAFANAVNGKSSLTYYINRVKSTLQGYLNKIN